MLREAPVTAVQEALRRRRRLLSPLYALVALILLLGLSRPPEAPTPYGG